LIKYLVTFLTVNELIKIKELVQKFLSTLF